MLLWIVFQSVLCLFIADIVIIWWASIMGEVIINIFLLLIKASKNTETFVIIFWRKLYGGSRILQYNITPQNGYLRILYCDKF